MQYSEMITGKSSHDGMTENSHAWDLGNQTIKYRIEGFAQDSKKWRRKSVSWILTSINPILFRPNNVSLIRSTSDCPIISLP